MNRSLLSLLLGFGVTTFALAGGTYTWPGPPIPPGANPCVTPVFPLAHWFDYFEQNLQRAHAMQQVDLVFDGDQWSITNGNYGPTGGMWNHFGGLNAVDFGDHGDTTQAVLWRLQNGQMDGLHPKLIVLEIGSSNIGPNTPEEIAGGIKADVAEYQKRCPEASILLCGVMPRGEKPTDLMRDKVKAINKIISTLGDGKKLIYVDFGDQLLQPDGTITRDVLGDFLHPAGKGYEIWAKAIEPTIKQFFPNDKLTPAAPTPTPPATTTSNPDAVAGTTQQATTPPPPVIGGGTVTWPSPPVPPGGNSAAIPSPPMGWLDGFQKKIDESHKMPSVDLIFDGDSITAGWMGGGGGIWTHKYAKLNAYDFAHPGDVTQGLIWQMQNGQADGLHPKLIVLLIGTNNLGHGTPEQIAEGIKGVIAEYQKHCPGAPILLQGIFPRNEKPTDPSRAKIKAVNKIISGFADGKTILFLDFGDKFLQPDGTLSKEIMPDLLHPSAKGYQIWTDAIQPVIDQYFPPAAAAPASGPAGTPGAKPAPPATNQP
jgi:lysophospholipase L1-like esterase